MNTKTKWIISVLAVAVLAGIGFRLLAPSRVVGHWQGVLDVGQARLRLVFKIDKPFWGTWTATLDSPDQGSRGIPVDTVTVRGSKLRLTVNKIYANYEGTLDRGAARITGRWQQGPQTFPLELQRFQGAEAPLEPEAMPPEDQAASRQAASQLEGEWNGVLTAGPANLHLRVNISKDPSGAATGTMDSLDQGARGIPLSAITLNEGAVRFEVRGIGGVYEGLLETNAPILFGQWQQAGQSFPLELRRGPSTP